MITLNHYFGEFLHSPEVTTLHVAHAIKLLDGVSNLMQAAVEAGVRFPINPVTKSQVSGAQYGGWRPRACPIGSPGSSHKEGRGIDLYDPTNEIDAWCAMQASPGGALERFGLYIEHPTSTPRWCHLTDRAPSSGNRVFYP